MAELELNSDLRVLYSRLFLIFILHLMNKCLKNLDFESKWWTSFYVQKSSSYIFYSTPLNQRMLQNEERMLHREKQQGFFAIFF